MHIAQLLFAHAGQAERELQIPVADLGESIGSLAMPFDMVFLDQKNLKGAMELHLVTVVEPDAGAMGDAEISEALSDVDPALREGSAELPPRPTEPVDGVQKKLPEVTAPGRLMADVAAQGDSKPTERSLSGEPNLTAATAVSSEPAPLPAEKWQEAVPAWYLRPTGMPEEIEGTPQKHAETEAPKALAGDAGENSTAEYVVPTDQTLATASGQQVANDVPALIAELPRAAPRLDILDIGARGKRCSPEHRHYLTPISKVIACPSWELQQRRRRSLTLGQLLIRPDRFWNIPKQWRNLPKAKLPRLYGQVNCKTPVHIFPSLLPSMINRRVARERKPKS